MNGTAAASTPGPAGLALPRLATRSKPPTDRDDVGEHLPPGLTHRLTERSAHAYLKRSNFEAQGFRAAHGVLAVTLHKMSPGQLTPVDDRQPLLTGPQPRPPGRNRDMNWEPPVGCGRRRLACRVTARKASALSPASEDRHPSRGCRYPGATYDHDGKGG